MDVKLPDHQEPWPTGETECDCSVTIPRITNDEGNLKFNQTKMPDISFDESNQFKVMHRWKLNFTAPPGVLVMKKG